METHDFVEQSYLTPTIRELINSREYDIAEDDSFFLRIVPREDMVAIRNNFEAFKFARGHVYSIHSQMLNSKVIPTIHKKLLAKIVSNVSIAGETDDQVKELVLAIVDFAKAISQAASHMLSRGEAIITTEKTDEGKIILRVYPLPRYDLTKNDNGQITEAHMFKQLIDGENKYVKYILLEHRYKKADKYYTEFNITKYVTNSQKGKEIEKYALEDKDIPDAIREILGDIKINRPIEIPKLGVYRFQNTLVNMLCPNSDIGESQYIEVPDVVAAYDSTFTFKEMDKHLGRGRVMMPSLGKALNSFNTVVINPNGTRTYRKASTFLDYTFLQPYESLSVDKEIPIPVQFNLRTNEWLADKADLIIEICTKCGLSIYDYNPAVANGIRTATEVDTLTDLTASTVKEKRSYITPVIDQMLRDIASLVGVEAKAFVKWDKSTTANTAKNNEIVISKYSAGLCSRETAIKDMNPNWNDAEVKAEIERIERETDSKDADLEFNNV